MISLFKPYMPSLPLMPQILESGALSYGQYTQKFEDQLREYFATPYVITTNSFSSAISVALASLGLKWGDEIKYKGNCSQPLLWVSGLYR